MAAVIESWFRQDLQKPVQVHYIDGSLFSNNGNGNRIGVELTNGGEDYTVTGTVSGYAVLADGSTVPCTGAKSGNKASILVPPAAYLPGNIFITIFLTDGTTVTTLAAVSSTVMQARTDNQVSPGSVVTDWTNTINAAMQSVETAAANLWQVVATPYAQLTFPVPLGKYTYYNNNLYRCTTPISSSEDFTAAHWSSALNLGDEVSDLKSALSDVASKELVNVPITIIPKKYIEANGTVSDIVTESYKVTDYIDVTGISEIYVSGRGDFGHGICAFYDSNKAVVSVPLKAASGSTRTNIENELVTVPDNAKYLVIASVYTVTPAAGYLPSAYYYGNYKIKPIAESDVTNLVQDLASKIGMGNVNFLVDNYVPYTLTIQTGKYIKAADGTIDNITGDLYVVADNIDVEGIDSVIVSGCATFGNGICAFYNASHTFLSWGLKAATGSTATIYTNELVSVPVGAKYMAVASMTIVAGNPSASYRNGYRLKKWTGLKWVCIGDSLTERNNCTTMSYHDYIAQETGITVVNFGKSGSGYKRVGGSGDNFYQRALTIPTDADVVTIFGSGNDSIYMSDADLGTATDTGTDTIGGCVNTCIDNIYSRIPAVQLGIVAPTPWDSSNPANTTSGWSKYVDLLRQICRNRSIPFLDLFHESNLRPWDSSFLQYAYSKDGGSGVHPDETGHKLIAGRFRVFVDSLLGVTDKPAT